MRFRHYDKLRSFSLVARYDSFTRAAEALSLTKGAVSHQIDRLEQVVGFRLFERSRNGIALTRNGRRLLRVAELAFASLDKGIDDLRRGESHSLCVGMATYFASRWLSPRLMRFLTRHDDVSLRIQPLIGHFDLGVNDLDMAVRWGKGEWRDAGMSVERLFAAPATLTASLGIGQAIETDGLEASLAGIKLLHDADGSPAWAEWFAAAGLALHSRHEELVIPDPNVRLEAVVNGQGVGLYDRLVDEQVDAGKLYRWREVELDEYGYYLVYPEGLEAGSAVAKFREWIIDEAARDGA